MRHHIEPKSISSCRYLAVSRFPRLMVYLSQCCKGTMTSDKTRWCMPRRRMETALGINTGKKNEQRRGRERGQNKANAKMDNPMMMRMMDVMVTDRRSSGTLSDCRAWRPSPPHHTQHDLNVLYLGSFPRVKALIQQAHNIYVPSRSFTFSWFWWTRRLCAP